MTIKIYEEMEQGSEEWYAARRGLLTASEMKLIITAKELEYSKNDKEKAHLYELVAQRITGYVEPSYIGDDMIRGMVDEVEAVNLYDKNYEPVKRVGFITNDKWGFTLGYSPDFLVADDGLGEVKSRKQKFQMETLHTGKPPSDYVIQLQTGLLVSERKWIDYISFNAGFWMRTIRVVPDEKIQSAIIKAADIFEGKAKKMLTDYEALIKSDARLIPTVRRVEKEMLPTGEEE